MRRLTRVFKSSVIQYVTCSKREDLVRFYQREQFFTSLAPATGMDTPVFHILRIVIVMFTVLLESFAKCFGRYVTAIYE